MDDRDFFVLRVERLVCQKWIIDDPRLWNGLLGILQLLLFISSVLISALVGSILDRRGDEIEAELIRAVLLVDHGAEELAIRADQRWIDEPQLRVFLLLRPQEALIQVKLHLNSVFRLLHGLNFLFLQFLAGLLGLGDVIKDEARAGDTLTVTVLIFVSDRFQLSLHHQSILERDGIHVWLEDEVEKGARVDALAGVKLLYRVPFLVFDLHFGEIDLSLEFMV